MTTIDIVLHAVTLCAVAAVILSMRRRAKREAMVSQARELLSAGHRPPRAFKDLSAEERREAIEASCRKFEPVTRHVFGPSA